MHDTNAFVRARQWRTACRMAFDKAGATADASAGEAAVDCGLRMPA
jgi:hypothetical protein